MLIAVAIVALATFGYVVQRVINDTLKEQQSAATDTVDQVGDGFKQAPSDFEPTAAAKIILDKYKALGEPSADKMTASFKKEIIKTAAAGGFARIDSQAPGTDPSTNFEAILYGVTSYPTCGGYGQELCFLVIKNDKGTFVSYVVDSQRGSPNGSMSDIKLIGFVDGDKYQITRSIGDGPELHETAYAITIATGMTTKIATWNNVDGNNSVLYDDHNLVFSIADEVPAKMDVDGDAKARTIILTDETGKQTTLVRKYFNPPSMMWDPASQQPFTVDYDRTLTCTDKVDPTWPITECIGKGLYIWIYGGLYFYDASNGEFTMMMDMSP